jgi:hypothetical protein
MFLTNTFKKENYFLRMRPVRRFRPCWTISWIYLPRFCCKNSLRLAYSLAGGGTRSHRPWQTPPELGVNLTTRQGGSALACLGTLERDEEKCESVFHSHPERRPRFAILGVPDGSYGAIYAQWERPPLPSLNPGFLPQVDPSFRGEHGRPSSFCL